MPLVIAGDSELDPGMVGDRYEMVLSATGGTGSLHWSIINSDDMPRGLSLDATAGTISGTPLPGAEGTAHLTIQVTNGGPPVQQRFSLSISPALQLAKDVFRSAPDEVRLIATGGAPREDADKPYSWQVVEGTTLPTGVLLDPDHGTIAIKEKPDGPSTSRITVRVSDNKDHCDQQTFTIRVRPSALRLRHRLDVLGIRVRLPSGLRQITHLTFWIAALALVAPLAGLVPILVYALNTPGPSGTYLGAEMLTALASLVGGCLAGFLFGIPKVVSTGQARQQSSYTPSSNLAEVSDWLTKLLLGAGLIQLTHLGGPVGKLIHHVAQGLYAAGGNAGAADVVAGAIIFGYMSIGLLDGYVVTTMWYQKKLASLNL